MTTDLKEHISKCDVCLAHCAAPGKEPLLQHEVIEQPWTKAGVYLCELHRRTLLVVCDYHSNYIKVETITKANTMGVSNPLKVMFSRYGVPK